MGKVSRKLGMAYPVAGLLGSAARVATRLHAIAAHFPKLAKPPAQPRQGRQGLVPCLVDQLPAAIAS
ncbi:hypothetical protein D3C84_1044240 [compost metagenome]